MNTEKNWKEEELRHLGELWNVRPKGLKEHTREVWNERAHGWEKELREDAARQERSKKRIEATARCLIERGILTEETEMIDIGCGPGRFMAEFAKTARHVTGLDISDRMTEYGLDYCREQGLSNVSFLTADFDRLDPEAEGMVEKYDLVFGSITPALGHPRGYEKALQLTNGWFFNANFISVTDTLQSKLEDKLQLHPVRSRDGAGFYCMLNELLLKGYYPELMYYSEQARDEYDIESAYAEYARWFYRNGADNVQEKQMKEALESLAGTNGRLLSEKQLVYAWVLVDKNGRNIRCR